MYSNSASINSSILLKKDTSHPLIITECGLYRLISKPVLPTYRPKGRPDWQLLYISKGKAFFHFDKIENTTVVPAGHMVLYRPKELQKYEYYVEDKTEVYWVHFSGSEVKNTLKKYGLSITDHVFYSGLSPRYAWIFQEIIQEIEMKRFGYSEMATMLLREIFIQLSRLAIEGQSSDSHYMIEIEAARRYFFSHYNESVNIEQYALSIGLSVGWFISCFKEATGLTPMQYILSLRISNAQSLLLSTTSTISEISNMVGYTNPLYFSRIFKKFMGVSPSEYRKQHMSE